MIFLTQLKIIFRNWSRNTLSTGISMVSLVVGFACSVVLLLFVFGEYDIARSLGDTDGVCIMRQVNSFYAGSDVKTSAISKYTALEIREKYPEVSDLLLVTSRKILHPDSPSEADVYAVSPNLPDFFDIPVLEGDLKQTLTRPGEIALTRSAAARYFGAENPMNRVFESNALVLVKEDGMLRTGWVKTSYTVTTLLGDTDRLPLGYDGFVALPADELVLRENEGQIGDYFAFFRLCPEISPEAFEQKINTDTLFRARAGEDFEKRWVGFVPVSRMYFLNDSQGTGFLQQRDRSLLFAGLSIALAVLVIGTFNFINVNMTRSASRLKNIAGQRIMGASRREVVGLIFGDTALQTIFAFLFSLLLIWLILPVFNTFMNTDVRLTDFFAPRNLSVIFLLLASVTGFSAFFILLRLQTAKPLQTFRDPVGGRMKLVRFMVILQFVISVVLVSLSITIGRQMNYIAQALPESEKMIIVKRDLGPLSPDFVNAVSSLVGVVSATSHLPVPTSKVYSAGFNCDMISTDPEFFRFYGIELLSGRIFDPGEENRVVVNETYVRKKGLENPVGADTGDAKGEVIVGVVKDYVADNVRNEIQPLKISCRLFDSPGHKLVMKIRGNADETIASVRELWKTHAQERRDTDLNFERVDHYYRHTLNGAEHRFSQTVQAFMFISIFLTVLGLFGLSWYTVQQRTKEIALRKIHGATSIQVMSLLCLKFMSWVAVAMIVALPVGYWLGVDWLSGFAYRVDRVGVGLLLTAAAVSAIALATVSLQSWRAANANPADSIKAE